MQHPELSSCLSKMSDSLDKTSQDGRIANVWTALTIRALQLIQDDMVALPVLDSKKAPSTVSTIADRIISKIFLSLSQVELRALNWTRGDYSGRMDLQHPSVAEILSIPD